MTTQENNFGVVEVKLNTTTMQPIITMTLFNASGSALAGAVWQPSAAAGARVRAYVSPHVCNGSSTLTGVNFTLSSPAAIPARAKISQLSDAEPIDAATWLPGAAGAAFRPVFFVGDTMCRFSFTNNTGVMDTLANGATFYDIDADASLLIDAGRDNAFDAVTSVPMRSRLETDKTISRWALLFFQGGLIQAVDVNDGAKLFDTNYYRLPSWPAHWTSIDAATFYNSGAATQDASEENGRVMIFRGQEFIVYTVARCYGRGSYASCLASDTNRDFGFELVTTSTIAGSACAHSAGVRSMHACFNSTGYPKTEIINNGGVDGE